MQRCFIGSASLWRKTHLSPRLWLSFLLNLTRDSAAHTYNFTLTVQSSGVWRLLAVYDLGVIQNKCPVQMIKLHFKFSQPEVLQTPAAAGEICPLVLSGPSSCLLLGPLPSLWRWSQTCLWFQLCCCFLQQAVNHAALTAAAENSWCFFRFMEHCFSLTSCRFL